MHKGCTKSRNGKNSLDVNRIRSKHDLFSLVWRGECTAQVEQKNLLQKGQLFAVSYQIQHRTTILTILTFHLSSFLYYKEFKLNDFYFVSTCSKLGSTQIPPSPSGTCKKFLPHGLESRLRFCFQSKLTFIV